MAELYTTPFTVTLASAYTSGSGTLSVSGAAPSAIQSGTFRVRLTNASNTVLKVTSGAATTTWAVTAEANDANAASGSTVYGCEFSAGALDQIRTEDGSPYFACPALSALTWVNQGTATATQTVTNGPILLHVPDNSNYNLRGLFATQPSTPYKFQAQARASFPTLGNNQLVGMYFYDGTRFLGIESLVGTSGIELRVSRVDGVLGSGLTSVPKGGSQFLTNPLSPFVSSFWTQLRHDGTTLYTDYSLDGFNYENFYSEAVGTFLTPTKFGAAGVSVVSNSSYYINYNILSWNVVANATL